MFSAISYLYTSAKEYFQKVFQKSFRKASNFQKIFLIVSTYAISHQKHTYSGYLECNISSFYRDK